MNSIVIRISSFILKISSIGFIATAFYHLLAIFMDLNNSTASRNILFVIINLWCAFEIRRAKIYFIVLFTALLVQQVISHGNSIIKNIHEHHTDWLSIFALTSLIIIYFALILSVLRKFQTQTKPHKDNP